MDLLTSLLTIICTAWEKALHWVLGPPVEPAKFEPFSRLPVEVRLMIWRASWTPKLIQLRRLATRGHQHPYLNPAPKGNVPATLWVNRESRRETERFYRKINNRSFHSYINEDIDTVWFYSCRLSNMGASSLVRVQSLSVSTCTTCTFQTQQGNYFQGGVENYWLSNYAYAQPPYLTMGNFLHNFKPQYLPKLTRLRLWTRRAFEVGKVRKELRHSICPLFFRFKGGAGGLWIAPTIEGRNCSNNRDYVDLFGRYTSGRICAYLVGIEIQFLGPRQAARFVGEEAPAAEHRDWLQFVSLALWGAVVAEFPLAKGAVDVLVAGRQDDYLQ